MPNATVRANAPTLPETTNRRAVLGAVLAAGAAASVAAIPAVAKPALGADHPDAALLALGPEIEAADHEFELRTQARDAAEEVFFSIRAKKPEFPESAYAVLTAQEAEEAANSIERGLDKSPVGATNALIKVGRELRRRDAALKAWEDDLPGARLESGLVSAEDAQAEAYGVCLKVRDEKLVPTRARTLEGLIFKARYAASHSEDDYDEEVMISIVDDLLALGEEAQA